MSRQGTTRPPYATDLPDSAYAQPQKPDRRIRHQQPPEPDPRTSAYNVYDDYLDAYTEDVPQENNKHTMLAAATQRSQQQQQTYPPSNDSQGQQRQAPYQRQQQQPQRQQYQSRQAQQQPQSPPSDAIPLAAPRPGYAVPLAALGMPQPAPAITRQPGQGQMSPPAFSPAPSMSTPHPLDGPQMPITPAFARPRTPKQRDVKFTDPHIMRGNSEETLIPKRGERGDDFWRRFSMVAKDQSYQKESSWLKKTQDGKGRLNKWVWLVGIVILLAIGGAAYLVWLRTHKQTGPSQPKALGGKDNERATFTNSATGALPVSSLTRVVPTNTVARREVFTATHTALETGFHRRHRHR